MHVGAFHSRDLEGLVALWNRGLPADPISPARLESCVLLDPNYRDDLHLVAREGGRMVGFVLGICGQGVHWPGERAGDRGWILALAVDPQARGRGVGSALLEEVERRFRALGRCELWMASYPTAYLVPGVDEAAYAPGLAFLQRRGYRRAYTALAMDASLWPPRFPEEAAAREAALAGQGIAFHTYSARWLSPFRAFLRAQVPWDWEYLALRDLARIQEGTFAAEQLHLAVCGEEAIGYCQYEGEHFGPFGVAEGFQNRGIGTVLLARALRSMAGQGAHDAWVLWTGDRAARLYARFGFQESRRFAVLHKALAAQ